MIRGIIEIGQFISFQKTFKRFIVKLNSMDVLKSVTDSNAVDRAVNFLKGGHVIAVPTDTVYGLACCATNSNAIEKLYEIKSRDENKPVAICLGKVSDINKWAKVNHLPKELLSQLLPGPVTLILETTSILDKFLCLNGKVGVRIPNYSFMQEVVDRLHCPLALTSANVSSQPSSVNVTEFAPLWNKLSAVFDGGILGNRSASTIVDLSQPGFYTILRNGIALEETCKVLNSFGLYAL